jgi:hypothetical protein
MLAIDWASFGFLYNLDLPVLVPHLVAMEECRGALLAEMLPPRWLDPAEEQSSDPRAGLARNWITQRFAPGSEPALVTDILTIHRLIAEQSRIESGRAGRFRTIPVRVGRPSVGGYHFGAPAQELDLLMHEYVRFVDSATLRTLPPIIHALLAHFFLDTIHPFQDGNGRTSRLLAAAILSRRGHNLHGSYALFRHYTRGLQYHSILHRSWQRCPFDVTAFVAFGIEGFVTELRSVNTFVQMKLNRAVDQGLRDKVFRRRIGVRQSVSTKVRAEQKRSGSSLMRRAGCLSAGAMLLASTVPAAPNSGVLSAHLSTLKPIVGVTEITIVGTSGPGHRIVDTATFPDGSVHRYFLQADARGQFVDGPFILQQLGTYHDTLRDETSGVSTTLSVSGLGDFELLVDPPKANVIAGAQTKFTVVFKSIDGLAGWVRPETLQLADVRGAVGSWSIPVVKVPSGGAATATFTLLTLFDTPTGTYPIRFQGLDGSVQHQTDPVTLSVTDPPPDAMTAAFQPRAPVVGLSEVEITGVASKDVWITDLSTFPDGSTHSFQFKSNGQGAYVDGPFVLKQLGTYHDVLIDNESGGRRAITYQGVGDFKVTVERPIRTITAGQKVDFLVTFTSLAGFFGTVTPSAEILSNLAGAAATWTLPSVGVRSGVPESSRLVIDTAVMTAGTARITVRGRNGSVVRAADIVLTVAPP